MDELPDRRGAIEARALDDVARDFAHVGIQHPEYDLQVDQREGEDQPELGVDQPDGLEDQIYGGMTPMPA